MPRWKEQILATKKWRKPETVQAVVNQEKGVRNRITKE
jgi:hypothetical protein